MNQLSAFPAFFKPLTLGLILGTLLSCSPEEAPLAASPADPVPAAAVESQNTATTTLAETLDLDVYKDPSCGCCQFWIDHAEESGFQASIIHPENLNQVKLEHGIAAEYQSCHTAVSEEGYVFEGHVPAKLVQQFLTEKPAGAIGLAVPGMPLGSPGMELGGRFTPYDVLLLKKDGSAEVYQHIASAEQQF